MPTTAAHPAQTERLALCQTLRDVGPDAPTLCSPWLSRHLAAHLIIRDRRPDLAAGMFLPLLQARHDAGLEALASRPWDDVTHLLESGPPWWHPARVPAVDDFSNTLELFIHHEDVLRSGAWPGPPRQLGRDQQMALWGILGSSFMKVLVRKSPAGIVVAAPSYGSRVLKRGARSVVLTGSPLEILLFVSGRQRVAQVRHEGPDEAVQEVLAAGLGV